MKPTAFAATEINLNEILDLDRYPIHAIGDAARTELVTEAREAMLDTGCFRVRDFVRPEAIETMVAEAASLHGQTFWSVQDHNPYFSPDDDSAGKSESVPDSSKSAAVRDTSRGPNESSSSEDDNVAIADIARAGRSEGRPGDARAP